MESVVVGAGLATSLFLHSGEANDSGVMPVKERPSWMSLGVFLDAAKRDQEGCFVGSCVMAERLQLVVDVSE